jgi:hypothetical protein
MKLGKNIVAYSPIARQRLRNKQRGNRRRWAAVSVPTDWLESGVFWEVRTNGSTHNNTDTVGNGVFYAVPAKMLQAGQFEQVAICETVVSWQWRNREN